MRLCKGNVTHGTRGGAYMTTASGRKVSCRPTRSLWYGGMLNLGGGTKAFRMMVKVSAKKPVEYALVSAKGAVYVHKKVLSKATSDALKQRILAGGKEWKALDVSPKKLTKTKPRFFGSLTGVKKPRVSVKKVVKPKKPVKKTTKKPVKKTVKKPKKTVKPKKK